MSATTTDGPHANLAVRVERSEAAARRAPEPLDLVQALVNTLNRVRDYDLLSELGTARWWLGRVSPDLDVSGLSAADLDDLVSLREGLRGLLRSATHGTAVDIDSVAALRDAGSRHPLEVAFDDVGIPRVGPAGTTAHRPAGTLAGRVLAALPTAATDGSLSRLKACANPDCEWAFYDTSRSRSGNWCVMNLCGARHKMSRYRDRLRTEGQRSAGQRSAGQRSAGQGSAGQGSTGSAANGNDSTSSHGPPR